MKHLLQALTLPDRYEGLVDHLGAGIAQVLVPPVTRVTDALERASLAIGTRREGIFIPVSGRPGAGKTTFANSLVHFFPASYRPTVAHDGAITFDALLATAREALRERAPNDVRVLPIALDHRERNPASDDELAAIKRFLRSAGLGIQPILLWPETNEQYARSMGERFTAIAGRPPIDLPLVFEGPPRESWQEIALNTLKVSNGVDALEELGVDPRNYNPAAFNTLGDFFREMSTDFDNQLGLNGSTHHFLGS